MKPYLLLILISIFSFSVLGQKSKVKAESCKQIALQDLYLGMNPTEVGEKLKAKLSPGISRDLPIPDFTFNTVIKGSPKSVSVYFYKGLLYRISVFYDDSVKFTDFNEFAETLSKNLGLTQKWKYSPHYARADIANIECPPYRLSASRLDTSLFSTLEDKDISELELKLKKLVKEKTFKP